MDCKPEPARRCTGKARVGRRFAQSWSGAWPSFRVRAFLGRLGRKQRQVTQRGHESTESRQSIQHHDTRFATLRFHDLDRDAVVVTP